MDLVGRQASPMVSNRVGQPGGNGVAEPLKDGTEPRRPKGQTPGPGPSCRAASTTCLSVPSPVPAARFEIGIA